MLSFILFDTFRSEIVTLIIMLNTLFKYKSLLFKIIHSDI